jgi:hypothetical protein
MADSLFDNRYRYDYIYPRGRSGETLRAVDTKQNDRPVVIKRPAPGDAPPIRAGQEVSILNERRALTRLAGHPTLTELLGDGQFTVGGMTHQYIVMERAEGIIIADEVLRLAKAGERLPELETLVIVDRLLDLLNTAHLKEIVYNDVDAKHLFWNRDQYRLKVIDWGNTVFLEGDEVTPQGISRQSDIYQTGELLYFVLTGGKRPDVPRNAGEDFRVDFGENTERISERLQTIISKALHPNPRLRYTYISELRRDLADYRTLLERERDGIIGRVNERLRRNLSKNELRSLLTTLDTALAHDPGFPPVKGTQREIQSRLQDLEVEASLDAVRIYMESANWSSAAEVLAELREKAGAQTARVVNLLSDVALILLDSPFDERNVPPDVVEAVGLIFDGEMREAAQILLTSDTPDNDTRRVQWLLAERISSHVAEILLLRPNLYRIELALASLAGEGISLAEPRTALAEIRNLLDSLTETRSLPVLRDAYRTTVDRLSTLNTLLSTTAAQYDLSNRKLPLTSLDRALNAAMALADNMHVIGKQATGSPRDAMSALDSSSAIDPTSPVWEGVGAMLDTLYRLLQSYQTYVPVADGSDFEGWLRSTQGELSPFLQNLFDDLLVNMVGGLKTAEKAWADYANATLQGNRGRALDALTQAIEGVNTISPTLAGWLNQLRSVIDGTAHIERHALYGGLGRALADGWDAFDRSRLGDAERLGQHAYEIARSEGERFAAQRLRDLSRITRDWVERNAALDAKRTHAALQSVEALYTPDEVKVRDNFTTQMPTKETYLRAMNKGIVEIFNRSSTAASRILSFNYVLLGTLDAHDELLEDAGFWREAALRVLGDGGSKHIIVRTLDEFVDRRRDLDRITKLLNGLNNPESFKLLEKTRRLVEENPQAKTISPAVMSVREVEAAVREWADGDFRPAGLKLENALKGIDEVQSSADVKLQNYRDWVSALQAGAAELHVVARGMRAAIEKRPTEPDETIRNAHHRLAQTSMALLGAENAATLIGWRDTYERFLSVYVDRSIRRSQKLERFNELFRAMFIDRHPAYPLYRHWYETTERAPEFPAPPTEDPTPRIDENAVSAQEFIPSRYRDEDEIEPQTMEQRRGRSVSPVLLIGALIAIGAIGFGVFTLINNNNDGSRVAVALTISATPTATNTLEATAIVNTATSLPAVVPTTRPSNTPTSAPATPTIDATPTEVLPTDTNTALPPTLTFTPSITNTPTNTTTFTPTATFTLPPTGLQGTQNLLELLPRIAPEDVTWNTEEFELGPRGEYWRLGVGGETPEEEISIALSSNLLNTFYGNNAATRIRRVEATMSLLTANPQLPPEEVFFGLAIVRADAQTLNEEATRAVGLYIQAPSLTAINVYQRVDDDLTFHVQQATNFITARIRIERDVNTGSVTLYLNDGLIGQPIPFGEPDVPVLPALFVQDGGVVVSVTNWEIVLR